MNGETRQDHPYVAHYSWPSAAVPEDDAEARAGVAASVEDDLLQRFRLLRWALAAVTIAIAMGFIAPAIASVWLMLSAWGEKTVRLRGLGAPGDEVASQAVVSAGDFLLVTLALVALVIAAVLGGIFLLKNAVRPNGWIVILILSGAGLACTALVWGAPADEIQSFLRLFLVVSACS